MEEKWEDHWHQRPVSTGLLRPLWPLPRRTCAPCLCSFLRQHGFQGLSWIRRQPAGISGTVFTFTLDLVSSWACKAWGVIPTWLVRLRNLTSSVPKQEFEPRFELPPPLHFGPITSGECPENACSWILGAFLSKNKHLGNIFKAVQFWGPSRCGIFAEGFKPHPLFAQQFFLFFVF